MSENYYAETAFNSREVRALPRQREKQELSPTQQLVRLNPITSRGLQCREYISYYPVEYIELLNDTSKETLAEKAGPGYEFQEWSGLQNPRVIVETISKVLTFFWSVSLVAILLGYFLTKFDHRVLVFALFWPGIPFIIDKFSRLALKRHWIKDKNNIIVNRRTGLVTFTWKKERVSLPFVEFDVCMPAGTRPTGSHDYYLRFVHKYSDKWFQHPTSRNNAWEVEQDWEFWQQYMDISQPLPDIPKLEPYRKRDPVTAEWDRQHHRPNEYWKNLPMDKAETMRQQSRNAAKSFPWGMTRKEAMASGWRPSGVGEGDWLKNK